jgi:hypothetical protein
MAAAWVSTTKPIFLKNTIASCANRSYTRSRKRLTGMPDYLFQDDHFANHSGRKRSRFTPPKQEQPKPDSSRSSSLSSSDARKKEKKTLADSTKRRATMNSRNTDYEDEMLRRAIEESSKDSGTLGKRTRDDGDECV